MCCDSQLTIKTLFCLHFYRVFTFNTNIIKIMAKTRYKQLINEQLREDNNRLTAHLKTCEKQIEFLENYRKVLSQFNRNCVCDQNKITSYLFRSLERQYKQICLKTKDFRQQMKYKKSGKSVANITEKSLQSVVTKTPEESEQRIGDNRNQSHDNQILVFNKQKKCILRKCVEDIDKNNENIIKRLVFKNSEPIDPKPYEDSNGSVRTADNEMTVNSNDSNTAEDIESYHKRHFHSKRRGDGSRRRLRLSPSLSKQSDLLIECYAKNTRK